MSVHQFVPVLLAHDAVGNSARELQERLSIRYPDTKIYVEDLDRSDPDHATPVQALQRSADDVLIYHYANFSTLAPTVIASAPTVLYYHNITPEEYFTSWDPDTAIAQRRARQQLQHLVHQTLACLAVSDFNAHELLSYGAASVATVGLFAHYDQLTHEVPTERYARLLENWSHRGEPTDWLFVGRLVPNKAQEELLAAFRLFRQLTGQDSSLTLIGRPFHPNYLDGLRRMAQQFGIAHRVHFLTGGLRARYLADHYRAARLFVSASRHEGFGAPLLEAMSLGLPVVAVNSSAVPETLGDAGLIVEPDDPLAIAGAAKLACEPLVRQELLVRSSQRVAHFSNDAVWRRLSEALANLAGVEVS